MGSIHAYCQPIEFLKNDKTNSICCWTDCIWLCNRFFRSVKTLFIISLPNQWPKQLEHWVNWFSTRPFIQYHTPRLSKFIMNSTELSMENYPLWWKLNKNQMKLKTKLTNERKEKNRCRSHRRRQTLSSLRGSIVRQPKIEKTLKMSLFFFVSFLSVHSPPFLILLFLLLLISLTPFGQVN